jgi:tetratricopeptide (TPR) repeat protein
VQHAHQKGIIHRDLKPNNVLVAMQDGRPAPKIIDFGVAKAIDQRLTEHTLATAFAQMVGTPLYMAPEQAELSPLGVDTRSDIYSLGVLLYELLTGTTPFHKDRLRTAPFDELRRIIRDEEPPKPSARVSTLACDLLSTVAGSRRVEPRRLSQALSGDLDWIVMKCLEKDRTRRYETADALALDVQRHLDNEPVVARPPASLYRFQKFVRRNKLACAAGSAVLAALILGLGVSTWMFFKERDALRRAVAAEQEQIQLRKQAQANEQKAYVEATKSEEMAAYLSNVALAVGEGNLAEARRLVEDMPTPVSEDEATSADWLRFRGDLRAIAGRWKEAAADFSLVVKFEPENHLDYHALAPLLVASGDLDGYRRVRPEIIARFGKTKDPAIAERMVKDCLILPASSEAELAALAAMADVAVAAGPNHSSAAFFRFAKGLCEFRQGDFTSASDSMEQVLTRAGEYDFRDAQAYMVLAMCRHQLNQPKEARAALAKGNEIANVNLPRIERGNVGVHWFDWITAHALQREAIALIEGQPTASPESPR